MTTAQVGWTLVVSLCALGYLLDRLGAGKRRGKRKPTVYVQGGPVPVLGAAELTRAVRAMRPEKREAFRAWSRAVAAAIRTRRAAP